MRHLIKKKKTTTTTPKVLGLDTDTGISSQKLASGMLKEMGFTKKAQQSISGAPRKDTLHNPKRKGIRKAYGLGKKAGLTRKKIPGGRLGVIGLATFLGDLAYSSISDWASSRKITETPKDITIGNMRFTKPYKPDLKPKNFSN